MLDASISLAWFVDDPVPELAIEVKRALETGSTALVPALWHLEMANGLALAERRREISAITINRALDTIESLLGSAVESSSTIFFVRQAYAAARSFVLTACDGVYLETARQEHLPLATLDNALRRAAAQLGVALVH